MRKMIKTKPGKDNSLKIIDIRYIHEIRPKDTVNLNLVEKKDEPVFFVKGTDSSDKSFFECFGQWQR